MRNSRGKILSLIFAFFVCGCFPLHANAQTDLEKQAEQVIYLTNLQRISAGLPPYQTAPSLKKIAFERSAELTSSFSHIRPNGEECWTIFDNTDIQWTSAGENIAYETLGTAENAVSVWMKSPNHRGNILSGDYNYTCVGVTPNSNGVYYLTQLFLYVDSLEDSYIPDGQPADDTSSKNSSLTGDIDKNGRVNVLDATIILIDSAKFAVSGDSDLTAEQVASCDFDENGVCNSVDASYILQYASYFGAGNASSVTEWFALIHK
jgi:uncharacterized protein YkwD